MYKLFPFFSSSKNQFLNQTNSVKRNTAAAYVLIFHSKENWERKRWSLILGKSKLYVKIYFMYVC